MIDELDVLCCVRNWSCRIFVGLSNLSCFFSVFVVFVLAAVAVFVLASGAKCFSSPPFLPSPKNDVLCSGTASY